jgi:Zn-dependent protease
LSPAETESEEVMRTFRVGTFRGIRVQAHWGAAIIAGLVGWLVAGSVLPNLAPGASSLTYAAAGLAAGVGLIASIFVHEAAHALVARHYGVSVSSITLWLLGGVAHLETEAPSPKAEARIAGVGPASSVALAAVLGLGAWLWQATGIFPVVGATLMWLGGVNLILAVFNLLPGAPLDGGRLLHAWLWRRKGSRDLATVGASRAGRVLGGIIVGVGTLELFVFGSVGGLWTALIGWFLATAARQEQQVGSLGAVLADKPIRDFMRPLPPTVPNWLLVHDVLAGPLGTTDRLVAVGFDGTPTAIITVADLSRLAPTLAKRNSQPPRVRDLQLPAPKVVDAATPAREALRESKPVVVTDGERLVGIVTPADVARATALHQLGMSEASTDEPVHANRAQAGHAARERSE